MDNRRTCCRVKSKVEMSERKINLWRSVYEHNINRIKRIDSGEDVEPDTVNCIGLGVRKAAQRECLYAKQKLEELGVFDLKK